MSYIACNCSILPTKGATDKTITTVVWGTDGAAGATGIFGVNAAEAEPTLAIGSLWLEVWGSPQKTDRKVR
jgi:hypothetical protein